MFNKVKSVLEINYNGFLKDRFVAGVFRYINSKTNIEIMEIYNLFHTNKATKNVDRLNINIWLKIIKIRF